MRAAFLPTPADPYVCRLWWEMSKNFINEVDRLYVYINSPIEKPVVNYLLNLFDHQPKIVVTYLDHMTQHGSALAELTKMSTEESVMFIEDDAFVLTPGSVDRAFKRIEKGETDLIGSARMSSSLDIQKAISRRFNVDLSLRGDCGGAFWPNFLFAKREDLLKTDLDFNAHGWKKGEYIKELDWIAEPQDGGDIISSDTFVWGSIQLRALGLRVSYTPQYHCNPFWDGDYSGRLNVFESGCPWMHAGSLSGSIYGILKDRNGVSLAYRTLGIPPSPEGWKVEAACSTEGEKKEFQRRIAFYRLALDLFDCEISKAAPEFSQLYREAVERVVTDLALDNSDIEAQKRAYQGIMNL